MNLTDKQIIKALERCFSRGFDESTCYECPFYTATAKCVEDLRDGVLDLINRKNAEIERLQNRNKFLEIEYKNQGNLFWARVQTSNLEAIKEFTERLKRTSIGLEIGDDKKLKMTAVSTVAIDKLVKEMTEEKE